MGRLRRCGRHCRSGAYCSSPYVTSARKFRPRVNLGPLELRQRHRRGTAVIDDDIQQFLANDCERIVRVVTVICGNRQRAEDAVQEALVDVWAKRRIVDDLSRWVTTAAINRARSKWRGLSAERRAQNRLLARTSRAADQQLSPFDELLADSLAALPRSQREAVALHYLLDLSVAAIALHLGVADGTVKTHLHRGRASLRAALDVNQHGEVESDV